MQHASGKTTIWAHRVFFPLACLYAALTIPLAVFAMTSGTGWPAALLGQGHAFEMLFGFALAVVAGYTLGPTRPAHLAGLSSLWLAARVVQLNAPFSLPALALSMFFGLALAWQIVPRFLGARRWRNRLLIPLLGGLCALPMGYLIARLADMPWLGRVVLHETVLFLAILMAFMGGRIIAPAMAGEFHQQGRDLKAREQPRVEGALVLLLMAGAVALATPGGQTLAGTAAVLAGMLAWLRLVRWRVWHCCHRADLMMLVAGYTWLGLGLVLFGMILATGGYLTGVLHVITIGALGTLSSGVMVRIHYQRLWHSQPPAPLILWLLATIAAATVMRVAALLPVATDPVPLLWISAAAWSLGFGVLGGLLVAGQLSPEASSRRPSPRS